MKMEEVDFSDGEEFSNGGDGAFPTAGDDAVDFGMDTAAPTGWKKTKLKQMQKKVKPGSFGSMGLSDQMLHNVHKRMKYNLPTPIQRKTIPLILEGLDVVGMARTGSGKTAAFVIPMLEKLREHSNKVGARAVIVSPTRELSLQTFSVVQKLSYGMNLRTAVLVGGDSMTEQFKQLAANPDTLIATPGRLGHIIVEVKDFSLRSVEYAVFDEADRLFEMGFSEQIRQITAAMGENRQTLLFSATLPKQLAEFTMSGLHDPEVVRLDTDVKISPELKVLFFTVRIEDKPAALLHLLREVLPEKEPTIVFVSTKHHVEFLAGLLRQEKVDTAYVYGAMDQAARKIQVAKFRSKVVNRLIVTDVAARGIDLPLIDNVVHYDFPATSKLYVHRSGRAARAGRSGTAYSLLTKEELPFLLDLHLYLSRKIEPSPTVPSEDILNIDDESVYGTFAMEEIESLCETVRERIKSDADLSRLQRSVANGFRLYLRSRQAASASSCKRAKALEPEGCHPFFLRNKTDMSGKQLKARMELAAFTQKLKHFRPTNAVFTEKVSVNRANPKRKLAIGQNSANQGEDAEEAKRQKTDGETPGKDSDVDEMEEIGAADKAHGPLILELNQGRYRDEKFFINHQRKDHAIEASLSVHQDAKSKLESAVMDMMGEDQQGMMASKRRFHWEKRGRKFVQLPNHETVQAGKRVKTESGAMVTVKKGTAGQLYERWAQNNNNRISAPGSMEDSRVSRAMEGGALDGANIVYRRKSGPVANADAENELKTVDQVRKARKTKAKNKLKNMPRNKRRHSEGSKGKARKFGEGSKAFMASKRRK
ncbi:hypothetical protein BSKO_02204 [Bryopsis sp. KO-2023]|nr:hypothetical protein BSKO_02204 [Bryopsis sp. KO-2023]